MSVEKIAAAIILLERRRGKVLTPETRAEWARRLSQFREDVAIESIRVHADGGADWVDCRALVMTAEKIEKSWASMPEVRWVREIQAWNKTQIAIGAEPLMVPQLPGVKRGNGNIEIAFEG